MPKNRGHVHVKNMADQFQAIENMVQANHPFVRHISCGLGKTPTIVLYTEEQLFDLKKLCGGGHSVLGVDKTFNLGNMHVIVTCYKQITVKRRRTGEPTIFLHDTSDFES